MFKAAIKNLLGHKLRMFLTGFSIILGVSFVSGTYIFTDSIGSTFDNLFSEVFSGTDLTVRPKQADFGEAANSFDENILETIKKVDGVSVASAGVSGFAQLLDRDGKPVGGQGPPTLGFSWGTEAGLNPLVISDGDGRAPTAPGEIIIDKATATTNGFKVGDTVKVITQVPAEDFQLVGIATFGSSDGLAGATLTAFEFSEAQRVFGLANKFSEINIKSTTNVSPEELKTRIDAVLPDNLESITGQEQSNEQVSELNEGLGFINTALLAFAGISVFVGSFIIQNTFRITVTQRSKELALLRAIGASKVQIVRLVIYEAAIIALLASIAAIFLGLLVANGVRALMNSIGFSLPDGSLSIEPRTVFVSLAVGIIVTLISAIVPAIKASKVSPIEAMRENEASGSTRKSLFKRGLSGTILIIIGALLLVFGLGGDIDQPIYAVGAGVVAMFIGVSVIAPLLSVPLAKLIGWPLVKARGVSARLAKDNAMRTPRRTASSAAALMIGVSLITMLSILATTFKSSITALLDDSFPADISVYSNNIGDNGPGSSGFSSDVETILNSMPEITNVTSLRYQFEGAKLNDKVIFIAGVDADSFDSVASLGASEGAFEALQKDNGIVINKTVADENGWVVGQDITLEFAQTGKVSLKLLGTFDKAFDSDFILSTKTYFENFSSKNITLLAMNFKEDADPAKAKEAVINALNGYPQLTVQDKGDIYDTAVKQIDQILGLFWGLLGFAIIIAVLGITNTLMLSISERTKEIGMLRAIGMTRKQVRKMVRYESIIIALFGAVLGVTMGAFFAWAVLKALESEGISGYTFPLSQIIIYFILSIIAGIFAAAWPARKAARMDILKAIYHD
ncbi:MAG: FtsX-like permease family protein [Candidatus Saccharibacteria bacterium]|nr:FtsX-like permease family protein [Candidatus Saccharibacteria bacterium]